jgi:GAF domain-containing protein
MSVSANPNAQEGIVHDIKYYRSSILKNIFTGLLIVGTILLFASAYTMFLRRDWILIGIYFIAYIGLLAITFIKKLPYAFKASLLLLLFYLLAITGLLESGLSGDGRIFLLSFIILAVFLFGFRVGIITGVIGLLTLAVFGWGMSTGFIAVPPVEILANSSYGMDWLTGSITFALIATIFISALSSALTGLSSSLTSLNQTTKQLSEERKSLEATIEERTLAISKKANQLVTANQITEELSVLRNPETIFDATVNLIRSRLNYYHASVFVVDEDKEFAVIKASTGEAGQQLLARNHKLHFGEGVVGYAVQKGEVRIASNVLLDSVHYKNPLLPDTRSEVAIPLIYRNEIIGALDVQSVEENAFDEEGLETLKFISNGLATTIYNLQEISKLNEHITELESKNTGMVTAHWDTFISRKKRTLSLSMKDNQLGSLDSPDEDITEVMEHKNRLVKNAVEHDGKYSVLAMPIKIRDEVIGVIDVHVDLPYVPENLLQLSDAINARLSIALENARLVEELEDRTVQEKLIAQITNKVRATTEIDHILKTAAEELGKSLGASEVLIQLDPSIQS